MLEVAQNEQSNNARPEIKDPLTDISKYDIILLGYPIQYSHIPKIIITQLESLDLKGKTIYPFNTHGGSGRGSSINDIKQYAKDAEVKEGFPLNGNNVKNNKESAMREISSLIKTNFPTDESGSEDGEEESENVPKVNSWEYLKIKYFLIAILLSMF